MARELVAAISLAFLLCLPQAVRVDDPKEVIDFRKHIEPIFREHCLRCHGTDKRKGGLLLATRRDALAAAESGKSAIVPGAASKSELLRRVLSQDKSERMPPSGPRLTSDEVARLRTWID